MITQRQGGEASRVVMVVDCCCPLSGPSFYFYVIVLLLASSCEKGTFIIVVDFKHMSTTNESVQILLRYVIHVLHFYLYC